MYSLDSVKRAQNGAGKNVSSAPVSTASQQSSAATPVVSAAAILSSASSTSSQSSSHHIDATGVIEVSAVGGDPVLQPSIGEPLLNGKEKTPMCLVNELARFNKVCCMN